MIVCSKEFVKCDTYSVLILLFEKLLAGILYIKSRLNFEPHVVIINTALTFSSYAV